MRSGTGNIGVSAFIGLLLSAALVPGAHAQTIAITGGTVYPVSGPKMENATVLIQEGEIVAVGTDVAVPAGAERIDATGKWVTPGFIHGWTTLGLRGVESINQTNDHRMDGDINASFQVVDALNPRAVPIPVNRLDGLTTAVSAPGGDFIQGQAAVIDLAGDRVGEMVVDSSAGTAVDFTSGSSSAGGGTRAGVIELFERLLDDAREYAERRDDYRQRDMQDLSAPAAELEALQPVLAGELPVLVTAHRASDIRSALRIADEYDLRMVLLGGGEAWKVKADLAAADVPVGVNTLVNIPDFDALGARLDNVTELEEGGVKYFIIEAETGGPRNLRYAAGMAVRNGLTWDQALEAITLAPAQVYGIDRDYGSLEPGKVANVVVWSGDPLDFEAEAEHVLIRGEEIPHVSRQTELLERYRDLPPEY